MAVTLLCAVGTWAQTSWTSGATVGAGEYYLYNVGAQRFINRGHAYKYRSMLDGAGSCLTLTVVDDAYTIQFEGVSNAWFGTDLYVDKASNNPYYSTWSFEPVEADGLTNAYALKSTDKATNTDNHNKYVVWGGSLTYSEPVFSETAPTDNNGYWLLIPKATRQNNFYSASSVNPVDVTYLIQNPDFEQNITQGQGSQSNLNGWTGDLGYHTNNASVGFDVFVEKWTNSADGGHLGANDFYQSLSLLPAGNYRLVVDAFAAAQGQTDKADCAGVYVYANSVEQQVATGEVKNTFNLDVTVLDGNLKIGMKSLADVTTANWIGMDNVRLYYLGGGTNLYLQNNSFETGSLSPWVTSGGTDTGVKRNDNATYTISNADGSYVFNTWDNGSGAKSISQTYTNLPAGTYNLYSLIASDANLNVTLKAGATTKSFNTGLVGKGVGIDNLLTFTVTDDNSSLEIGATSTSWYKVDNFRLQYFGAGTISDDVVNGIIGSVASNPMNGTVRSTLASKLSAKTIAAYNDAKEYLANEVQASINAYATAASVITKMETLLENTNFYTTTAYSNFNTYITNYENESLTDEQATGLNNTIFSSTKNAGLGAKLIMSNFEVNGDAASPAYYANTWSTEGNSDGSGMTTPFVEYWVSDANTLAARTLTATQTGLTANATYAVRALVRVKKSTGSEAATPSGITMQVGSGSEVDVCGGTNVNTSYWYGTYTATGTADESGNLTLKFIVDGETSVSWLAIKNIKYMPLDFSALSTAIATTEAALGFDDGEYAPYANTAKMTALANAKAVLNGSIAVETQDDVDGYTTALTSAAWTAANSGSVNAVYNPAFALSENDGAMAGWSTNDGTTLGTAGHSRAFVLTSGMTNYDKLAPFGQGDGTRSCAYMRWDGYNSARTTQYIYGATTGYTMPLKADVLYRLTLELGGWGQTGKSIKVAITNEAGTELSSETETTDATAISSDGTTLSSYSFTFRPTTEGNYYLVISNPGSGVDNAIVVSNINLTKVDELAENTEAVKAGDITSMLLNPDFEDGQEGWNGQTGYLTNLTRGWHGDVVNKFIERTSTGAFSQVLYNMPAGTYKVVAAARGYDGGKITAAINGTSGTTLNCVGDTQSAASEINTNGVQMPYSSLGGFTTNTWGHNWQWITATATLAEAGTLTVSFNVVGTAWMAIDDVHLYYMTDGTTARAQSFTEGSDITSSLPVTCDIVVTNPNTIISSDAAITGAVGVINNNLVSGTIANLVLYDGYSYTSPASAYAATAAKLYRSIAAEAKATVIVPFALDAATKAKGKAYQPKSYANDNVSFESVDAPAADKPYIFVTSEAVTELTGTRASAAEGAKQVDGTKVTLYGTYASTAITKDANNYVASAGMLWLVDSDLNSNPFRAYLHVDNSAGVKSLGIAFDDATAIDEVESVQGENAEVYNLAGQRLAAPHKGVNIVNGKKVLVK